MNESNGSDERKFLHDIASPLGNAMLILDIAVESLRQHANLAIDEVNQLGKIEGELQKIKQMLVARREILIARGVPSSSVSSSPLNSKESGK